MKAIFPRARRLSTCLRLLPALFAGLATAVAAPAYDYFLTGNPVDAKPAKTTAGLLLAGGGTDNDDAFRWFAQSAGGGDIVILRASGKDGYNDYLFKKIGGVDSVETLLFHDRSASSDPRVLEILAHADGIFLAGGDQSKYVRYWKGTPVGAALDAHVRAGKPLGGTSAGLAVLGQFAFSAMEPGDVTTALTLKNPLDPAITLEADFLHFDLLRGVITDTHFMARARLGRSLAFLARLLAEKKKIPRLLGIGIDERTALCVEPDGSARLFTTNPEGRAWLLVPSAAPEILTSGQPLTFRDIKVIAVGPQSTLNLTTLAVTAPTAVSTVSVVAGKLSQQP